VTDADAHSDQISAAHYVSVAKPDLSDAIQDYLREIYKLGVDGGRVSVTALAKRQGVSPASASAMVKKLAALGLAVHQPYRGIALTSAGEQVALEVIRHHRLLELYLAETLGVDVEQVHGEAERLEHALSEELEERIDKALGFPTHDPHGDPIPDANLEWPSQPTAPAVGSGQRAKRSSP
jgi:DtxR family Mn-dependent transcriptional regulator